MALGPRHDRIISATLSFRQHISRREIPKAPVRFRRSDIRQLRLPTDLPIAGLGVCGGQPSCLIETAGKGRAYSLPPPAPAFWPSRSVSAGKARSSFRYLIDEEAVGELVLPARGDDRLGLDFVLCSNFFPWSTELQDLPEHPRQTVYGLASSPRTLMPQAAAGSG